MLNCRATPDGTGREFLVSFGDGRDDEWVPERNVSADVLEDYLAGLEYAVAEEVLDVVQVGGGGAEGGGGGDGAMGIVGGGGLDGCWGSVGRVSGGRVRAAV